MEPTKEEIEAELRRMEEMGDEKYFMALWEEMTQEDFPELTLRRDEHGELMLVIPL